MQYYTIVINIVRLVLAEVSQLFFITLCLARHQRVFSLRVLSVTFVMCNQTVGDTYSDLISDFQTLQ